MHVVPKQEDLRNNEARNELTVEFLNRLRELNDKGFLRHGLAAMALAMQEELANPRNWGQIEHGNELELMMRGIAQALVSDASQNTYTIDNLSNGYIGLMCRYRERGRKSLEMAFQTFRKVMEVWK
jgi:hypothetical protein